MFNIKEEGDVVILEAKGEITKEDYTENLVPFLNKIKENGKKARLLFHAGGDFEKYTIGASIEDFKLGIHHFFTFEKCAIVTDISWMKKMCKFFAALMPCPIEVFANNEIENAKKWLHQEHSSIACQLDEKNGILDVEVSEALSINNFHTLSQVVDPWIEKNNELHAIIIHTEHFPFWENLGALASHISFVKNHHKHVEKVALVANGILPHIAPALAKVFVKAKIKSFKYNEMYEARDWVKSEK